MIEKKEFCTRCPFHDVELIHTELEDNTSKDYCPKCQELFGGKIGLSWKIKHYSNANQNHHRTNYLKPVWSFLVNPISPDY